MLFHLLHTNRLTLRKLDPDVYHYVYANYTDAELMEFFGLKTAEELQKEKEKYRMGISTFNRSFVMFQLLDKETGKLLGSCGFHTWYTDHKRAEIGYAMLDDSYKGRGLMKEAMAAVIDHGFGVMRLHRIEALISPDNIPSLKLATNFNFVKEGHLREHYIKNGILENSDIYSLLEGEYKARQ